MPGHAAGLLLYRKLIGPPQRIEYLLLQSSNGIHHWTPPKGHIEEGEDEFTASLREVNEETGFLDSQFVVHTEFKKILQYNVGTKNKIVTYWLAQIKDPNRTVTISNEHQTYKWLDVDAACCIAKYSNIQELIREADEWIKKKFLIVSEGVFSVYNPRMLPLTDNSDAFHDLF